jgi:hypothetical protein
MKKSEWVCFFIMPFDEKLHYFYLYLKQYIETNYHLRVIRADEQVLTKPLLDKITDMIKEAEVIVADCSDLRPNVLYELGIAHALNKKVILLSHGNPDQAPSDIRHFEFIFYKLDRHAEFLSKLDNALHNILFEHYAPLYDKAQQVCKEFQNATGLVVKMASKDMFISRIMHAEKTQEIPDLSDEPTIDEFVLPQIIENTNDLPTIRQIAKWLSETIWIIETE